MEYGDLSPFTASETVTVVVNDTGEGDPPSGLAASIEERIRERTDRDVEVGVRFQEYRTG